MANPEDTTFERGDGHEQHDAEQRRRDGVEQDFRARYLYLEWVLRPAFKAFFDRGRTRITFMIPGLPPLTQDLTFASQHKFLVSFAGRCAEFASVSKELSKTDEWGFDVKTWDRAGNVFEGADQRMHVINDAECALPVYSESYEGNALNGLRETYLQDFDDVITVPAASTVGDVEMSRPFFRPFMIDGEGYCIHAPANVYNEQRIFAKVRYPTVIAGQTKMAETLVFKSQKVPGVIIEPPTPVFTPEIDPQTNIEPTDVDDDHGGVPKRTPQRHYTTELTPLFEKWRMPALVLISRIDSKTSHAREVFTIPQKFEFDGVRVSNHVMTAYFQLALLQELAALAVSGVWPYGKDVLDAGATIALYEAFHSQGFYGNKTSSYNGSSIPCVNIPLLLDEEKNVWRPGFFNIYADSTWRDFWSKYAASFATPVLAKYDILHVAENTVSMKPANGALIKRNIWGVENAQTCAIIAAMSASVNVYNGTTPTICFLQTLQMLMLRAMQDPNFNISSFSAPYSSGGVLSFEWEKVDEKPSAKTIVYKVAQDYDHFVAVDGRIVTDSLDPLLPFGRQQPGVDSYRRVSLKTDAPDATPFPFARTQNVMPVGGRGEQSLKAYGITLPVDSPLFKSYIQAHSRVGVRVVDKDVILYDRTLNANGVSTNPSWSLV